MILEWSFPVAIPSTLISSRVLIIPYLIPLLLERDHQKNIKAALPGKFVYQFND
jgi:hypothetical protein